VPPDEDALPELPLPAALDDDPLAPAALDDDVVAPPVLPEVSLPLPDTPPPEEPMLDDVDDDDDASEPEVAPGPELPSAVSPG
jgi:hypothetical protein